MILVFGCRQSEVDHIYKEETTQAKNKDVFKELYTAYSREPGKPKVQALKLSVEWNVNESACRNPEWRKGVIFLTLPSLLLWLFLIFF